MKKDLTALIILLVLVLIFFAKAIIGNEYFTGLDIINQFYPWKNFVVQSVKSGEIPLWNPYTFCGSPFIGNFQASIFYPLDIIFFFTSIANAFRISLLLHIFLSGAFTYLLARYLKLHPIPSIFAACVYMFNAYLMVRFAAGHWTMINGYPWVPMVFYLFLKTVDTKNIIYFVLLALVLAIQFVCGHPQVPYYTLLALFIYLIGQMVISWKKQAKPQQIVLLPLIYFGAVMLAAGLVAVQIIPAWFLGQHSATRAGGMLFKVATDASLAGKYLILFFDPTFFGAASDNTFWGGMEGYAEIIGYVGILPLLLTCYAWWRTWRTRNTMLLSILMVIALILALGKYTPVYHILYNLLPGFNLFRCPGRWLLIVDFAIALLSGIGLHQLIEDHHEKKMLFRFLMFLTGLGCLILLALGIMQLCQSALVIQLKEYEIARLDEYYLHSIALEKLRAMIPGDAMFNRFQMMMQTILKGLVLFLVSSLVFFFFWQRKTVSRYLYYLPILIILADLWSFSCWYVPSEKAAGFGSQYYPNSGEVEFLKSDHSFYRILCLDEVLSWMETNETGPTSIFRPNRPMVYSIYDTRGYDPLTLKNYIVYINHMLGNPANYHQGGLLFIPSLDKCDWQMLSRLNVKYIISVNELMNPNLELVFSDQLKIYRNNTMFPRAYFISGKDAGGQPEISLPDDGTSTSTTPVTIIKYAANQIEVNASVTTTGYLVLSEINYPGWRVTVDGQRQSLLTYRDIFRSVYLSPGQHQVVFSYAPAEFRWGLIVSILSLIGSLGIIITALIVRKNNPAKKIG